MGQSSLRQMAELSGLPPEAALEKAHEVLFHVGLGEARYRQLGTYSLGMKQLAKLAQAIAHGPRLLLLDEPTNGLDPEGRTAMLDLIARIGNEFGIAILVASHLLGEVESVCEYLVVVDRGRLLYQGATKDLLATASESLLIRTEPAARLVRVLVDVVDALGVEGGGAADDAVDLVPLREQELDQVRSVLAGDAGDQCLGHALSPGASCWPRLRGQENVS